jgi:hypothetical protein
MSDWRTLYSVVLQLQDRSALKREPIDNALTDSEGRTVALSAGARVTLTVEATPHAPAE